MDVWRYMVNSMTDRKSKEAYLPLLLSAVGALGVLPFAILRFIQQAWLAAIVDTIIMIGFMTLGWFVYRTRKVRTASRAIALLCVVGVLTTVYVIGPQQVYWTYPALMAIFYLTSPKEAVAFAIVTLVALLPVFIPANDSQLASTVIITIIVTTAFAFAFSLITNRQSEQLMQMATKDPLTGAGNRRALDIRLEQSVNRLRRSGETASLVLLDLDHFKSVNDKHGHAVGDLILKHIADIINLRIRITDSLFRIGGEEFVIVLDGQNLQKTGYLAEQLRVLVEANEIVQDKSVTISLGVAEIRKGESGTAWLSRADAAMYCAKANGRNATSLSP
ncbi:MAG TPA: GGDEF domain-containing protein [Woeseiaceae bacterium]